MRKKKRLNAFQNDMIRILQISGISLMTLGFLNSMFLNYIHLVVNIMLMLCGLGLLWSSYKLWRFYHETSRQRKRYKPSH
jgi:hypothetical protein